MNDENSWVIGGESTGGRWNKQCNYPTAIGLLRGQDFGSGEFKSLLLSVDRSGLKEFRSAGFLFGTNLVIKAFLSYRLNSFSFILLSVKNVNF